MGAVVYRMAESGVTRLPVVNGDRPVEVVGILTLEDLLRARVRHLEEERDRERVLHVGIRSSRPDRDTAELVG